MFVFEDSEISNRKKFSFRAIRALNSQVRGKIMLQFRNFKAKVK